MNNQAEKFHQENGKMIQQLVESLDAILDKFDEGIIPGEPEKSDAMYMLDTYLDTLIKFKEDKQPVFKRIADKEERKFDEKESLAELSAIKESVNILLKLAREKMLLSDNPAFKTAGGVALIEGGYCSEIITGTIETHYYILSEKGEKAVKSKSLLATLRNDICTAIIPQRILNESYKWSDLYVRRVEMINKYYRVIRNEADHIIFTLDESKELVFGCEIGDSEDINYVFAGIFDEKIDDHISQVKSIATSGKIDSLIILNSSEDGRSLLEGEGLNMADCPRIRYELLK